MSARGLPLLALLLALSVAPSATGAEPTKLLGDAIDAYTLGLNTEDRDQRLEEFRKAERFFGRVLEDGSRSPDLYTNLGNAALQAERLGTAVLAYRRALRLDPSPLVRGHAAWAIGRIGGEDARRALAGAARSERTREVLEEIALAAESLPWRAPDPS